MFWSSLPPCPLPLREGCRDGTSTAVLFFVEWSSTHRHRRLALQYPQQCLTLDDRPVGVGVSVMIPREEKMSVATVPIEGGGMPWGLQHVHSEFSLE